MEIIFNDSKMCHYSDSILKRSILNMNSKSPKYPQKNSGNVIHSNVSSSFLVLQAMSSLDFSHMHPKRCLISKEQESHQKYNPINKTHHRNIQKC